MLQQCSFTIWDQICLSIYLCQWHNDRFPSFFTIINVGQNLKSCQVRPVLGLMLYSVHFQHGKCSGLDWRTEYLDPWWPWVSSEQIMVGKFTFNTTAKIHQDWNHQINEAICLNFAWKGDKNRRDNTVATSTWIWPLEEAQHWTRTHINWPVILT